MSMFSAKPSTTVRQQSPWLLPRTAYLVVFLLVGAGAFLWKYAHMPSPQPLAPPQATARVCIHQPTFAYESAWREILSQAKSEVRDHLNIERQPAGDATVVGISLSDLPPGVLSREAIVPLINVVSAAFVQTCRSQWKIHVEQAYSGAQQQVRDDERLAQEADSRLELLRQRQSEDTTATVKPEPRSPVMVENPQWTEAARRLAELEERRRVLLFERTPLHPSVQEVEMRIGDARREMAAIPPKVAQGPAAKEAKEPTNTTRTQALLSAARTLGELEAAQQTARKLHDQLRQAEAAARAALTARNKELGIDLEPAKALPDPPPATRFGATLWAAVLVTAATSVIGVGMISFGASLEPALSNMGELQALLPVPIVGVVPAVHPARSAAVSTARRRLARYASIAAGIALLTVVAWLFFLG